MSRMRERAETFFSAAAFAAFMVGGMVIDSSIPLALVCFAIMGVMIGAVAVLAATEK